jgi:hypothetical protein
MLQTVVSEFCDADKKKRIYSYAQNSRFTLKQLFIEMTSLWRLSRVMHWPRLMTRSISTVLPAGSTHVPVLLPHVLEFLKPQSGAVYCDATYGDGGYTRAILGKFDILTLALAGVFNIIHSDNCRFV